ncbi:UbiA family prenyltransferase [bacterium]|nr:UbiA family prenyltransferase [bacterium]
MKSYLKAMRLGRWPRSLVIFIGIGVFFLLNMGELKSLPIPVVALKLFLAFLLTWAVSTANYILNEIVDAPFDVHHPTKKNRPLVQGQIKKIPFLLIGVFLILASLSLSYIVFSSAFLLSLSALFLAGVIYNVKPIRTKDIPFLDSISESANNPIRFLIGWFTFASPTIYPPLSLLLSWWSFGNFLMIAKRLSEFRFLQEKAGIYRASLKRYSQKSMVWGMGISAGIALGGFVWFAWVFGVDYFLYLSPLIALYLVFILIKTLREKEVMEEPEGLFHHLLFTLYTSVLIFLFFLSFFVGKVD